jgi:hypothetical protein
MLCNTSNKNQHFHPISGTKSFSSENACYRSFQNLPFRLLSKIQNIKIHKIRVIIVSVVLYGCETWFPTLQGWGCQSTGRIQPAEVFCAVRVHFGNCITLYFDTVIKSLYFKRIINENNKSTNLLKKTIETHINLFAIAS